MPEGPSIVILREQTAAFRGRKVLRVGGNSKLDLSRMQGCRIDDFRSWGKHFLICFDGFAMRVHFMLFGSYRIDDPKDTAPRLTLDFGKAGRIDFYACSLKYIEGDPDETYDWSADVMSDAWDPKAARRKLEKMPGTLVCDALLDQDVFAGVGNIIKNEVLFRIRVHPESAVGALPARKLSEMIAQAREYSFDFLEWKKAFVLRKHYQVHTRTICPRCSARLQYRAKLGTRQRRSFFCGHCQRLYSQVDSPTVRVQRQRK
ncbi:endonuclease [Luteimonas sp. SX5]|uniref:Endonuclease n=1 Tax=Luteimonas galliterrae TaxID=2940486 RepID=A0ABT0MN47_9GAMM|nr:DNA-formamidopyrimidine glycosylase family protein [Luteimonas galliterrae]MCL1635674.1 endonuclease [Luteimonas galliterrae]